MSAAATRNCANCKAVFTVEPEDFDFYQKVDAAAPTWCPPCRMQRRLLFRNERTYYKRACDLCKKNIISVYPADAPHPVYCVKCWWSDNWDPAAYGRDFDFNQPFFDQYKELLWTAPAISIFNDDGVSSVNCEYSYDWFYSKNCYMVVCGWHAENAMYYFHGEALKDAMDSLHTVKSELVYDCILSQGLNRCLYCVNCRECQNCFLSYDLQNCSNCVLSVGLRGKNYCIRNKQYSKEEYFQELEKMDLGSRAAIEKYKKELVELSLRSPRRYAQVLKSTATTGDYLINCKNSQHCFFGNGLENCKYITVNDVEKDSYDLNMTGKAELCYDSITCDHAYMTKDTVFCIRSKFTEYSQYCASAESCFGCVGMKKGMYSIFNKKYSKEEYEQLRARIVEHMKKTGEWGEFFPHWVSPFAYNETASQEWFPLSRAEAEARGYRWREPEAKNYQATLQPADLPDTIEGVTDDVLNQVIGCEHAGACNEKCSTAFRVVPAELQLYRRLNVPLPKLCPNCRHYGRIARRNPPQLWHRQCACDYKVHANTVKHAHHENGPCPNEFEVSYAPDRLEIVYCEACYNAEVA